MSDQNRLPPLKALRALEAVHKSGSVVGAARILNVSHSAISHQIKALENWTSHPLFVRHGRTTLLTEAGKSLAGVTHEAFDSIRHEIDRLPLRGLSSITIGSLPLVATEWLMPKLKDFRKLHPDINLHISIANSDHPINPLPDIEIRFGLKDQLMPDDMTLISGTAVPVCSPELLDEFKGDEDQLLMHGPLVYDEDLRMWSNWFEQAELKRDVDAVESGLLVEGSAMLRSAARSGCGVALCRTAFLGSDLDTGRLVQLSDVAIDDEWGYFIRCSDAIRGEPGVVELLGYLGGGIF
jgi:LysR family glycine cleavage system transcriptional activator